jgi:hypothetical protein
MKRAAFILVNMLTSTTIFASDGPCVISDRGHFQIDLGTAGSFGAFAHDHLIEAEKITGCATMDPKDVTHFVDQVGFPDCEHPRS